MEYFHNPYSFDNKGFLNYYLRMDSPDIPHPSQEELNLVKTGNREQLLDVSQRYSERDAEIVETIFNNFKPDSGLEFIYEPGRGLLVFPPKIPVTMTDDELVKWGISEQNVPESEFESSSRAAWIDELREMKEAENRGGFGITARDMSEVKQLISPIEEILKNEHGKVVILGNGFGTLAKEIADMHTTGQFSEVPVVDELFDYKLVLKDLLNLREQFENPGVAFPLTLQLSRVTDIVDAINSGHLEAVNYVVGTGEAPDQLTNASLVLNIWGPGENTLSDQLLMLKPGGVLISNYNFNAGNIPHGFRKQTMVQQDLKQGPALVIRLQ